MSRPGVPPFPTSGSVQGVLTFCIPYCFSIARLAPFPDSQCPPPDPFHPALKVAAPRGSYLNARSKVVSSDCCMGTLHKAVSNQLDPAASDEVFFFLFKVIANDPVNQGGSAH